MISCLNSLSLPENAQKDVNGLLETHDLCHENHLVASRFFHAQSRVRVDRRLVHYNTKPLYH